MEERTPLLRSFSSSSRCQSAPPYMDGSTWYCRDISRHVQYPYEQENPGAFSPGPRAYGESHDDSSVSQDAFKGLSPEEAVPQDHQLPRQPPEGAHTADNVSPKASSTEPPEDLIKDQKRRMAILTSVAFFVTCASKVHAPVISLYIYQMYTDMVYGNASHGIQVSKEPCINSSNGNVSADTLRDEVQARSADLNKLLVVISGSVGIISNLVLGSYSDVLGRRFLLLVPIVGHFLRNVSAPIVIYFNLGLPALLTGYVIDGLCGADIGIAMGYYVYTADITKGNQRTMGMAIIGAVTILTTSGLDVGANIFIQNTGFFYPSVLAACLLFCSVLIVSLFLPETVPRDRKRKAVSPAQNAKRMFALFVLNDHPMQRVLLMITMLSFFLVIFPADGIAQIGGLFTRDEPFCMTAVQGAIRGVVIGVVYEVAALILIRVLKNVIPSGLVILGELSSIGSDVLTALAKNLMMLYISPTAGIASSLVTPALRSMMSSMVPPDRQGTLFAWIAMIEGLCMSIAPLAFIPIYEATMDRFRGFSYLVLIAFRVAIILLQFVYVYLMKRSQRKQFRSITVQTENPTPDSAC